MNQKTVTIVFITLAAVAIASSMGLTPQLLTGKNTYFR